MVQSRVFPSEHSEREGEAPAALPMEGATRAPILIAHRGARREEMENTLAAFHRAWELGCDGIECDVRLSADGKPFLLHDENLSRCFNGSGSMHTTVSDLLIPLRTRTTPGFEARPMATLSGLLTLIPHPLQKMIIEIKRQPFRPEESAVAVGKSILRAHPRGQIVVSSFSIGILRAMQQHFPEIPRGVIIGRQAFPFLKILLSDRLASISEVHLYKGMLKKKLVRAIQKRGWKIFVWTVNDERTYERCRALNVDGIMTDEIRSSAEWRKTRNA